MLRPAWAAGLCHRRPASLTRDDGNGGVVFSKKNEYSDFPLDEITLYFANNVIHLPSEYYPALSPALASSLA
jgi:hypothetical protein